MVTQIRPGWIEFAYFRPSAATVQVVGDFNHWQLDQGAMERDERGWWRLRLILPPGEYRFRYRVDGRTWETDFAAYGVEPDADGDWISVVWIEAGRPEPTNMPEKIHPRLLAV